MTLVLEVVGGVVLVVASLAVLWIVCAYDEADD